jgi:hypothetical protein
MGKEFDELARALANGVSRRKALRRFAAGAAGAAFASVFGGRSADAQWSPAFCHEACQEILGVSSGREYGRCVSSCASCVGRGGFPNVLNNGEIVCIGLNSINHG